MYLGFKKVAFINLVSFNLIMLCINGQILGTGDLSILFSDNEYMMILSRQAKQDSSPFSVSLIIRQNNLGLGV